MGSGEESMNRKTAILTVMLAMLIFNTICGLGYTEAAKQINNKEVMQIFKKSLFSLTKYDGRVFREDILLLTPTSQGELDFLCKRDNSKDTSSRFNGKMDIWLNGRQGDTGELSIPFYADQVHNEMDIFFKVGEQWFHYEAPSLASFLTDILATPTRDELELTLTAVKEVKLLQDNAEYWTMRVTLDGNQLANLSHIFGRTIPADKGLEGEEDLQDDIINYFDQGLRSSDPWYTWSVSKKDYTPIAVSYNLSGVIKGMAQAAMNDTKRHWSREKLRYLESVASYGELLTYTTFLDPGEKADISLPDEVRQTVDVEDMLPTE